MFLLVISMFQDMLYLMNWFFLSKTFSPHIPHLLSLILYIFLFFLAPFPSTTSPQSSSSSFQSRPLSPTAPFFVSSSNLPNNHHSISYSLLHPLPTQNSFLIFIFLPIFLLLISILLLYHHCVLLICQFLHNVSSYIGLLLPPTFTPWSLGLNMIFISLNCITSPLQLPQIPLWLSLPLTNKLLNILCVNKQCKLSLMPCKLMTLGLLYLSHLIENPLAVNEYTRLSSNQMVVSRDIRLIWLLMVIPKMLDWIILRPLVQWLSLSQFWLFWLWLCRLSIFSSWYMILKFAIIQYSLLLVCDRMVFFELFLSSFWWSTMTFWLLYLEISCETFQGSLMWLLSDLCFFFFFRIDLVCLSFF